MTSHKARWRTAAMSVAVVLALAVTAGCSNGGDDNAKDDSGSATTQAPNTGETTTAAGGGGTATTAKPGGGEGGEPASTQTIPPWGKDFVGILKDVKTDDCPTKKGNVTAKGTVKNTSDKAQDLLVAVIWLKKDSGDTLSKDFVTFGNVGPGDSKDWEIKGALPADAGQCVIQAKANKVGTEKDELAKIGR